MGQTITFNQASYVIEAPSRPSDNPPTGLVVTGTTTKAEGVKTAGYLLQNFGDTTVKDLTLIGDNSVASGLNVRLLGVDDATTPSVTTSNLNFGDVVKNDTLLIGSSALNTANMGAGNDKVNINFASTGDNFNLGSGSDQIVFGGAINGTTVDLGGDNVRDTVNLSQGASINGLVITGADNSDVLLIGTTQYNYNSADNNWINVNDPNDKKNFS